MTPHDFLDLEDLQDSTIARLLARATELEHAPRGDSLLRRVLGLLFLNPSLRTLASFQSGVAQLGGSSFVITPGTGTWQLELETGTVMDGAAVEHVREAIPVLAQYCDALAIRAFALRQCIDDDIAEHFITTVREVCPVPLINMESAMNHPCQALADWKTLDDLAVPAAGGRFVLSWAYHPKALPLAVPAAVAAMAARRGMDVTVLRPEGFALPAQLRAKVEQAAARGGGSLNETDDRAALRGAHVIYAKSWGATTAYGDDARDAELRAPLRHWCVDENWFDTTDREACFLHCLPVRRNVVVSDAVIDGPRSQVVRQASNRLHVQKAVLTELLTREDSLA